MTLEEIEEILNKYKNEEIKIEKVLDQRELDDKQISVNTSVRNTDETSSKASIKRNKQLLKELETAKGNLRSKAIFSPSELQWENIITTYQANPSLPVTTYKCHLPVFV